MNNSRFLGGILTGILVGIFLTLIVIYFNFFSEIFDQHQGWVTIISIIVAIVISYVVFRLEKRERRKEEIIEQLKIVEGLIAELEILSSSETISYCGCTEGNLDWYQKELENDAPGNLDHNVNRLTFDNYITHLNRNLCKIIDFLKLCRSLSYVNDKISQINSRVESLKKFKKRNDNYGDNKKYVLSIIKESKCCINKLKEVLNKQIDVLKEDVKWKS